MAKKRGHFKGYQCQAHYDKERRLKRTCSCGRLAIGVTKYGSPVCSFHNSFPTQVVGPLPSITPCPGPHTNA